MSHGRRAAKLGLELAYFAGFSHLANRFNRDGVILRLQRVRPDSAAPFQPLRREEVTPDFLDRAIGALKRWKFDFIAIDDVQSRCTDVTAPRFVCLTFDNAYRDFITAAYPVLERHRVPFTLYIPTGFVDRIAAPWWLALERIVADQSRISLFMDGHERRFETAKISEKYLTFEYLYRWMLTLPPLDLAHAVGDLCGRYGVHLAKIADEVAITWPDLARIAADRNATIASATVNYPVLAKTDGRTALREMKMGRSVLETAIGRNCAHFAYPFGDEGVFGVREVRLAREAGFATAVSALPGVITAGADLLSLPRLAWDGRMTSLRALHVTASGLTARLSRGGARLARMSED